MELPFTNLIMIIGGLIALTIAIIIYVYFNGGIDSIANLLFGVIRW